MIGDNNIAQIIQQRKLLFFFEAPIPTSIESAIHEIITIFLRIMLLYILNAMFSPTVKSLDVLPKYPSLCDFLAFL